MRKILGAAARRLSIFLTVTAMLCGLVLAANAAPAAAATKPLTVSITSIEQIGTDVDPGITQGPIGDFYAGVTINGTTLDNFSQRLDYGFEFGVGYIFPFKINLNPPWTFSLPVDDTSGTANVSIALWDNDDCDHPFCDDTGIFENDDDQVDISPSSASETLSFTVNLNNGSYNGDINSPASCVEGTGGEAVKICFDLSTLSASGDADGDGLLDSWEQRGYDADGNGTIDVDLPAMGANPLHKDLFLEQDYETGQSPSRADIQAMKNAFAAAPLNTASNAAAFTSPGGKTGVNAPPNPDGQLGVNIHVDMGNLVDTSAREGQAANTCNDGIDNGGDGQVDGADTDCTFLDASVEDPGPGTCADGVDNDGDGVADVNDTDCLVGDNLGGGNAVTPLGPCNMDANFYTTKRNNFNTNRARVFRYGLSAALGASCDGTGGQGEIGGNDFVEFNHDGGTVMHELGHTLNLHHGGNVDNNCKPNYVSGMNYDNQFGINRAGGSKIIDYSPPRVALNGTTRGAAPLGDLVENNLDDGVVLDGSDNSNRFKFVDSSGTKVQNTLNVGVNWNSDTDPPLENDQTINIDTKSSGGNPKACGNSATNSTLKGANDWTSMSLAFAQFGDSADGAIGPETTLEPTLQELQQLQQDVNTTDLSVAVVDSPDPVAAGTQLTYAYTVTNNGPNPSTSSQVDTTLPVGVTYVSGPANCKVSGSNVKCNLGEVGPKANKAMSIVVAVPANAVFNAGAPFDITSTTTVDNLAGPDSNPSNDSVNTTTRVVAVADLATTGISTPGAPTQIVIGETLPVSVQTTVSNFGPSSPMNAKVTTTGSASSGASAAPGSVVGNATVLAVGSPQSVGANFTIGCTTPGSHTYTFKSTIAPANAVDSDPVAANNDKTTSFTLDCVVPIAVNIKPGGNPNSINLPNSNVPLAALTTKAGEYGLPLAFDATTIKPLTVHFGPRMSVYGGTGGSVESHGKGHPENTFERTTTPNETVKDNDTDLVMHFDSGGSGLVKTDTEACIKGDFVDKATGNTYRFFGCDVIRTVPPK